MTERGTIKRREFVGIREAYDYVVETLRKDYILTESDGGYSVKPNHYSGIEKKIGRLCLKGRDMAPDDEFVPRDISCLTYSPGEDVAVKKWVKRLTSDFEHLRAELSDRFGFSVQES